MSFQESWWFNLEHLWLSAFAAAAFPCCLYAGSSLPPLLPSFLFPASLRRSHAASSLFARRAHTEYPHWQMRPELKTYYLLQASYWLQQALVMLLGLEAPRKDYYELIAHVSCPSSRASALRSREAGIGEADASEQHLVTLWLIGWSYLVNLTMIGTTVFVCMDIPDTWLAVSSFLPLSLTETRREEVMS